MQIISAKVCTWEVNWNNKANGSWERKRRVMVVPVDRVERYDGVIGDSRSSELLEKNFNIVHHVMS